MASDVDALLEEVRRFSRSAEDLKKKVKRRISSTPTRPRQVSHPELKLVANEGH